MPNGIMDRFLKKVNQKLTSDDAQCLPTHHYFKGHKFSKPVQKNAIFQGSKHCINLTFTTLQANSADDSSTASFLFFLKNRIWHFMQIVSNIWRQFAFNV